ncbi:MAG TPA: diguanylate cyclase, partial [Syntrophomonas sp.]|nr:diguanylate cyclase [Syntrophomonas sp.]
NVSIGSALYPDEATEVDELVNLADTRMYQKKRQTKQGYSLF